MCRALIRGHEGVRDRVYDDTRGIPTVGRGFNLAAGRAADICRRVGVNYNELRAGLITLTPEQIEAIFELQYEAVKTQARVTFAELDTMPDEAAAVVCDMIFNIGYAGFLEFRKFIAAVKAERWAVAIEEMERSLWAQQVPHRVASNVALMEQIGAMPILKG
jgi:GH24 family phage-related lysozyme (muramidase)